MAKKRPTRWQKAKQDWPGFQWQDLAVALVALVLAVVVLAVLGFPGKIVAEVSIVAGAGVAAALVRALGQLVWAWLQAPMRLLTKDVVAIRDRVEAIPTTPLPPPGPPFDMRYSLLNSIRLGQQLTMMHSGPGIRELEGWVTPVVALLTEHADRADAERFLRRDNLPAQLEVLNELLKKY